MQPAVFDVPPIPPPDIFSDAKMPAASSAVLGAEVPPKINWCAGKLGPWLV
jgi:hypothetical protein